MSSLKLGNIGTLVSFNSESSKMVTKRQVEIVIENVNEFKKSNLLINFNWKGILIEGGQELYKDAKSKQKEI